MRGDGAFAPIRKDFSGLIRFESVVLWREQEESEVR